MRIPTDEEIKKEFESWWGSTNNANYFSNKVISVAVLKETAFYAWKLSLFSLIEKCKEEEHLVFMTDAQLYQSLGYGPTGHIAIDVKGNITKY